MSLNKQLWLAIISLTLIAFFGSFFVSCFSAQRYLIEQLQIKNQDNAQSLAISLSANSQDTLSLSLYIAAQFDTGHYEFIRLNDTANQEIFSKESRTLQSKAPLWIALLFPIHARAGVAQVSDGWHQIGTLTLKSHVKFAYDALWQSAKNLLFYFILAAAFSGIIGSYLLSRITRPLKTAVQQAHAMEKRRFIIEPEPRTPEFKILIQSMNSLARRIQSMLNAETSKLEQWRKLIQHDPVTGALNREAFLAHFESCLQHNGLDSFGSIAIIKIHDLTALNQKLGRTYIDEKLHEIKVNLFDAFVNPDMPIIQGRLNGSNIALLLPRQVSIPKIAEKAYFATLNPKQNPLDTIAATTIRVSVAATEYYEGESPTTVLIRLDNTLDKTTPEQPAKFCSAAANKDIHAHNDLKDILSTALDTESLFFEHQPVYLPSGEIFHKEVNAVIVLPDKSMAGPKLYTQFLQQLKLENRLDRSKCNLTFTKHKTFHTPLCLQLSAASLADVTFIDFLTHLIQSHSTLAPKVYFEISEHDAYLHLTNFKRLSNNVKQLGCHLGLRQVGYHMSHLSRLHDLGLDYVKLDASQTLTVENHPDQAALLRSLCTLAHSIGLIVIAQRVESPSHWKTLHQLGLDGAIGFNPNKTQALSA